MAGAAPGYSQSVDPLQGIVLFHDASSNVLRRDAYDLEPGQTKSFDFVPPATRAGTLSGIIPCLIRAPGGRAVPNVEVMDNSRNVVLLINPAAARMSQFQQQEQPR